MNQKKSCNVREEEKIMPIFKGLSAFLEHISLRFTQYSILFSWAKNPKKLTFAKNILSKYRTLSETKSHI